MSPDDDLDDAQESVAEARPAAAAGDGDALFDIPPMAEQDVITSYSIHYTKLYDDWQTQVHALLNLLRSQGFIA